MINSIINFIVNIFNYFKRKKEKKLLQEKFNKFKTNPVLFSQRYLSFYPYPKQKEIINLVISGNSVIVKGCRQSGKTTTIKNTIIHQLIFNENTISLVAHTKRINLDLIKDIAKDLKRIIPEFGLKVVNYNSESIHLSNDSILWLKYQKDADIIYYDEFGLLPLREIEATYYNNSYKNKQMIIVSTKNKGSLFDDLWEGTKRKINNFVPVEMLIEDTLHLDEETLINRFGKELFIKQYT
jgi:hypothetical protein